MLNPFQQYIVRKNSMLPLSMAMQGAIVGSLAVTEVCLYWTKVTKSFFYMIYPHLNPELGKDNK